MGMTGGKSVALLAGAGGAFYVVNRAVEQGRAVIAAGGGFEEILPAVPDAIAAAPFRISIAVPDLLGGLGAAVIIALIVLYVVAGKQNTRPGEEHGSAKWAGPREIKPFRAKTPATELQKGMDGSEEDKDALDSETDLKFTAARAIVDEWHANPDPADDPQVMKVLDFACRQYRVYEQGPVETRKSVVISLGVRLAPLDMHDVRQILATDTIGLDRIGYEPTALFLQIPDTHATFKFVAAMFWQSLFEVTVYQADHEDTGRLPRMLHALLDEFANIGMIPNFERLIATIRSRNISVSMIFQNYSQGKTMFKDDWDTVVGNCDTKLFLGGDDLATAKWMSEMLGTETIVSKDTSVSRGVNGSWSESTRSMRRNLMEVEEIRRLNNDYAILMIRGLHPFKSRKIGV